MTLCELGYPDTLIAERTGVTARTVAKALRWFDNGRLYFTDRRSTRYSPTEPGGPRLAVVR